MKKLIPFVFAILSSSAYAVNQSDAELQVDHLAVCTATANVLMTVDDNERNYDTYNFSSATIVELMVIVGKEQPNLLKRYDNRVKSSIPNMHKVYDGVGLRRLQEMFVDGCSDDISYALEIIAVSDPKAFADLKKMRNDQEKKYKRL